MPCRTGDILPVTCRRNNARIPVCFASRCVVNAWSAFVEPPVFQTKNESDASPADITSQLDFRSGVQKEPIQQWIFPGIDANA
jgi:hypothetical protein